MKDGIQYYFTTSECPKLVSSAVVMTDSTYVQYEISCNSVLIDSDCLLEKGNADQSSSQRTERCCCSREPAWISSALLYQEISATIQRTKQQQPRQRAVACLVVLCADNAAIY